MPIVRDPRNDRRRRVLRENAALEQAETAVKSQRTTPQRRSKTDETGVRKSAGYSQDVRQACGHRLVQLIPVRPMSYACVIAVSLLIPTLLSAAHYLVYVNGKLPWYGHPLALTLDANYNRSIASWVTGQLWLLCLGATVLTFQLRRHKLDDYSGDYRLWFWLVLTCIIGSLESSTGIIQLFSMALNNWSTTTLGWSGPAVVKATLAVLVGMLGIRLCTELKAAPSSVVCVMLGLMAWATSSALAQPEFRIDLSPQIRVWARCSLWIGGLTCIWLAALANLRHVYIEAQQRFLSRRRMLAPAGSVPLRERIRSAMPRLPSRNHDTGEAGESRAETKSRWRLPSLRRTKSTDDTTEKQSPRTKGASKQEAKAAEDNRKSATTQQPAQAQSGDTSSSNATSNNPSSNNPSSNNQPSNNQPSNNQPSNNAAQDHSSQARKAQPNTSEAKQRRGLGGFFRRGDRSAESSDNDQNQSTPAGSAKPASERKQPATAKGDQKPASEKKPSRLTSWLRKPKHSDDAEEFRKISRDDEAAERQSKRNQRKETAASDAQDDTPKEREPRRWIPRVPKPKMPKLKKPSFGWLPKFNLSALRLKPPTGQSDDADASGNQKGASQQKPAGNQKLPSTSPQQSSSSSDEPENAESARPLTKAERKRLRRMQQQNRAA